MLPVPRNMESNATEENQPISMVDPKHTTGYRERFLIGQNVRIFEEVPFPKLHINNRKTEREKNEFT